MFLKSFESENNKGGTSYQCFRLRKEFEMKQRIGLEKEMDCDERKRYALTVVLRPNDPSLPVEEDPLIQDWSVVACVPAPKGSKPPWENIQEQVELKKVKKGWQADGIVRGFFAKSPVPLPLRLEDEDDDAMKARYEQIISLAQGWMHSCLMTHKKCNLATSKTTPSRLLYIGNDKVRLWERPRNSTTSLIYSTLSHCWGDTLLLKLQKHNISEFSKEIPDSKLCKTFLDAISIARKLHIDYIWIDALCIIQDENDWQKEAGLMSDVYKFSHMNITALSAHNGTEGCFFPPSSDNAIFNHQVSAKLSPDSDETALFNLIDRDLYGNAISSEPLAKRAWIYQERALAPRVLYLGREMVYFECEEQDYCEAWLDGIPHSALLWSTLRAKSRGVWTRGWSLVVETYSRCQMTFEHDKLVALSGVAKALQEETGDEYLAGMWRKEISLQIDWRPDRSFGGNIKRPLVYRAPSWSWASVDGPVRIRGGARPGERVCIQVLHARIVPKGANIFGEVSGGILRLGCDYLCRVSRKEDNWFLETGSTELWTRDKGWVTWDDDDFPGTDERKGRQTRGDLEHQDSLALFKALAEAYLGDLDFNSLFTKRLCISQFITSLPRVFGYNLSSLNIPASPSPRGMSLVKPAAIVFLSASFCLASSEALNSTHSREGWQSSGNTRSSWDILWSCLAAIFACTWTIFHLNTPGLHDSKGQILRRKVKWFFIAIVAPEILIWAATDQFLEARKSVAAFAKYERQTRSTSQTKPPAQDSEQLLSINEENGQAMGDKPFEGPWTLTHGFLVAMGGVIAQTDNGEYSVLHGDDVVKILQSGIATFPQLSTRDIQDRSKADGFAKGFALLQCGWLVVNIFGRVADRLPVSPLELMTLAYVFCALIIYGFWWNKPKDIMVPIIIRISAEGNRAGEDPRLEDCVGEVNLRKENRFSFGEENDPEYDWSFLSTAILSCLYGGIHIAAWSFDFSSHSEEIAWRVCSVCATTIPIALVLLIVVYNYPDEDGGMIVPSSPHRLITLPRPTAQTTHVKNLPPANLSYDGSSFSTRYCEAVLSSPSGSQMEYFEPRERSIPMISIAQTNEH
ncbi:hypothetical protein G7Y89_g8298 [Cudoniella acicularis]|uniref:Heterokaryon incompatibility domain-containing protein n=1 Tax=Cudoniella acicularis TaxID=354080 RepID=A0A8H4W3Q4_9HELO|nr:hypothetical protein G7Y89_g8298 [Cudoniella acicularis]